MSNRKIMQAPGLPCGPRSKPQPKFNIWHWLFGYGHSSRP
jgi:hypothetical protein